MFVSYDLFSSAFLQKITEYDFLNMDEEDSEEVIDGYMKRACARFSEFCIYDIAGGDDSRRRFTFADEATENEIEEIVEIVSEGMVVQWFKTHIYKQENLSLFLNTTDFTSYSPAELTYRLTNAYNMVKKDFVQAMREYSYRHGDLSVLHI